MSINPTSIFQHQSAQQKDSLYQTSIEFKNILAKEIVDDCLQDTYALIDSYIMKDEVNTVPTCSNYENRFIRSHFKLVNGSKFTFASQTWSFCHPIEGNSLQIEFSDDISHYLVITFAHRYLLWQWIYWLQIAYQVWSQKISLHDIPSWMKGEDVDEREKYKRSEYCLSLLLSHCRSTHQNTQNTTTTETNSDEKMMKFRLSAAGCFGRSCYQLHLFV